MLQWLSCLFFRHHQRTLMRDSRRGHSLALFFSVRNQPNVKIDEISFCGRFRFIGSWRNFMVIKRREISLSFNAIFCALSAIWNSRWIQLKNPVRAIKAHNLRQTKEISRKGCAEGNFPKSVKKQSTLCVASSGFSTARSLSFHVFGVLWKYFRRVSAPTDLWRRQKKHEKTQQRQSDVSRCSHRGSRGLSIFAAHQMMTTPAHRRISLH